MEKLNKIKKTNSALFFFFKTFIKFGIWLLYRCRFEKKTAKGIKRPCLILSNHQTGFDHFAIGAGFNFGINFVASDSIFRHGLLSKIMVALVRPIPFSKGSSDLIALKHMMSVIKDGGSVAMFPSGNRCCYGMESPIVPGIGRLAKKFNVPLVLVQLRGGYNTRPRWKTSANRGKMTAVVTKVLQVEELAAKTGEEVDEIIKQELYFNEFEYNKTAKIVYRGRRKAEYLESMLFYCPQCAGINGLFSQGNEFFCRDCDARVKINDYGFFERINNAEKIPETILEWSRLQLDYIKALDYSGFTSRPLFSDKAAFFKAERAKREEPLGKGSIEFYSDRLVVCGHEFLYTEITMSIIGARKMTIYSKNDVFAVIAPLRTNLMKYMICGYYLRNKALNIQEEFYGY